MMAVVVVVVVLVLVVLVVVAVVVALAGVLAGVLAGALAALVGVWTLAPRPRVQSYSVGLLELGLHRPRGRTAPVTLMSPLALASRAPNPRHWTPRPRVHCLQGRHAMALLVGALPHESSSCMPGAYACMHLCS